MKNLSCQITSPSFLDESFTTHIEIFTGKMFYHSEIGEFIASLPYQVADEIQRSVWRYIFSNKVLAIQKPLYFDWDDNTICHQDINQYIEGHIRQEERNYSGNNTKGVREIKDRNLNGLPVQTLHEQHVEIKGLINRRYETLRNVNHSVILQSDCKGDFIQHKDADLEYDCKMIKSMMVHNSKLSNFKCRGSQLKMKGQAFIDEVCMCISKTGCMCGSNCKNHKKLVIPTELKEKYAPLKGKCGIPNSDCLELHMCGRHSNEWVKDIGDEWFNVRRDWLGHVIGGYEFDDGLIEAGGETRQDIINKFERKLDLHLEQHNYHYKHGYWTKGDPCEGYTYDNSKKKPKKIPYEKRTIDIRKAVGMRITDETGGMDIWYAEMRGEWIPSDYYQYLESRSFRSKKKNQETYLPKFSKTLDKYYQDDSNPNLLYR